MNKDIKLIKKEAIRNKVPIIMDDTLETIKKILLETNAKSILEIGTATGYSAICFSHILNNDVNIDTIEFDGKRAEEAIFNIVHVKLEDKINVLIGEATEILETIDKKYDIVFIDAAKTKYPIFLEHALRLTNKGSVIIADNVLYKGYVLSDYNKHKQRTAVTALRKFLEMLKENPSLHTEILDVGDGLTVSYCR